jgi:hypothetical protein
MSGIFQVGLTEARGYVANPADIDRLAVVMGPSSSGSGLTSFFYSGSSAQAEIGYGDAPDTLCQIIEQRQSSGQSAPKFPARFYKMIGSTAGSYGTIDNTDVLGTALPTVGTTAPYGTYEAAIQIIDDGNGGAGTLVGTTGITYQWTLGNGRPWSNTKALLTATSIVIPNSNVTFLLEPPSAQVTAYVTYINAIRTAALAHFPYTTGTVHGAADTTSDDAVASAATNVTTGITLSGTLITALTAHFALGSSTHLTADVTTSLAAAVTAQAAAVAAPTAQNAITVALLLETALETHEANLTYHTVADAVNVVSATQPTRGTLKTGDVWTVRTFAPDCTTSDIEAAFAALVTNAVNVGLIVLEFVMTAAKAAFVTTGINNLNAIGIRPTVLARTRLPSFETSETESTWVNLVGTDFANFDDSRIVVRAGYGLITDAMTTRQYRRSTFAQFCADVVRVNRIVWPSAPADQQEANVTLVDSSGATVGHDEGPRGDATGLSDDGLGNRFSCEMRLPDANNQEAVYNTVPWTLAGTTDPIKNLMVRRIANAMERTAVAAAMSGLGGTLEYTLADPGNPSSANTLTETSRNAIHAVIYGKLANDFAADIQNADDGDVDSGLVQVNPIVTVSGGNLLSVAVTLAPKVKGYLLRLNLTFAVKE